MKTAVLSRSDEPRSPGTSSFLDPSTGEEINASPWIEFVIRATEIIFIAFFVLLFARLDFTRTRSVTKISSAWNKAFDWKTCFENCVDFNPFAHASALNLSHSHVFTQIGEQDTRTSLREANSIRVFFFPKPREKFCTKDWKIFRRPITSKLISFFLQSLREENYHREAYSIESN